MTPQEKGKILEKAAEIYLRDLGFKVYTWREWAGKRGADRRDMGIDLVAEKDNKVWAVQCKNWDKPVDLKELASFILKVSGGKFSGGYLFAKGVTREAYNELFKNNIIFISTKNEEFLRYLEDAERVLQGKSIEKEKKDLRPYQREAIKRILEGFEKVDRGQLLMPPGTGKTFVALKVAEKFGKGKLVLFLCPSIALMDQTIRSWFKDAEIPINAYAVVSDTRVGMGKEDEEDLNDIRLLSYPATTNSDKLLENFVKKDDELNVIFSTYQSLNVIKEAQEKGLPEFDLIICDEAHRTAGVVEDMTESSFKIVHSNEHIKGKKRLYMTATPKVYIFDEDSSKKFLKLYSMDDKETFGPIFYEYSFKNAINDGYITGFRIVALTVSRKEIQESLSDYLIRGGNKEDKDSLPLNIDDATKLVELAKFIKGKVIDEENRKLRFLIRSGIIFVNRVEESKRLAREFNRIYEEYFNEKPKIRIEHVDGNMPADEKRLKIEKLRKASCSEPYILTNAKVLTEGIDVPSLDFIAFFKPKKSQVDIIQALGRVVRKGRYKEYGLIFIPIVVDTEKGNIDEQISKTSYDTIWQVLNSVMAYDESYRVKIRLSLLDKKVEKRVTSAELDNLPLDFYEEKVFQIARSPTFQIDLFETIKKHLTSKIIKTFRIADETFLSDWADETAKIAKILIDQISISYEKDGEFRQKFEDFKLTISKILNEYVSEEDCKSLIAQYILTKPILDAIFTYKSDIDKILDEMFEYFKKFLESNIEDLPRFYERSRNYAEGLDEEDRQELLRILYTNFFQKAFKDVADQMGIAYTPVPLVSFIVKFVDFLTRKHFGKGLGDEGVVILEPFAGMGTFLSVLINHISKEGKEKVTKKLERKEIWANEILLLPYLIMLKNVEDTIQKNLGEYKPFTTALWTDSFNLMERIYEKTNLSSQDLIGYPQKLKEMVSAQMNAKINVIISNPPWRVGKEVEHVGKKNVVYPNLRKRIENTYTKYAKDLGAKLTRSLYDMYVHALRMATDRIEEGVIGLVLNNGWLYGLAGRGIRKALSEEFAEVYVYDLKGNLRGVVGEELKRQGENVFQIRTGNCLVFLVKKKDKTGSAKIYYKEVKDYATKEEKFQELREWEEKVDQIPWIEIKPNEHHDWINQGEEDFYTFIKLGDKKNKREITIFDVYSLGLVTSRDTYAYNFNKDELRLHMERLINTFNEHLERVWKGEITKKNLEEKIEKDARKIKWDNELKEKLFRLKEKQKFKDEQVFTAFYRPFVPMYVYFDRVFNLRVYLLPSIFPTPSSKNLAIAVSVGIKQFFTTVSDKMIDLNFLGFPTQLFPLYIYEERKMLATKKLVKLYNIKDEALNRFREELGDRRIEKEHIFFYVFGVLSTPDYKKKYAKNLKMELPRIPILKSFWDIADLGEKLAKIQLEYLNLPEYEDGSLRVLAKEEDLEGFVENVKMEAEKGRIIINKEVRIEGIPKFAFEYKIIHPPIRWISEYLKRKEDDDTGIVWDPKIKVRDFISLTRKLITLSQMALEIEQNLSEVYKKG